MPTLVLLAGPNGAGKTTFINRFLRRRAEVFRYVNPDEVARGLTGAGAGRDLAAGRLVLERLDALFAANSRDRGADVVLETTLVSRSHAVRICDWKAAGYRFDLIYLRLPSLSSSSGKPRLRGADRGIQRRARARTCRAHSSHPTSRLNRSPSAPLGPSVFAALRRRMTKADCGKYEPCSASPRIPN